ncbi:hypothetical protein AsFcp4_4 [Aeromonas phage AsFcp_4]|nr:hypothetical protein AsFcp4_4 [Aeromonas phage AsFcp_4]
MSLPSRAIFVKDGEKFASCFINCGWSPDDVETLRQIIEYVDQNPVDFDQVVAYGRTYSNDLELELLKVCEERNQWREIRKINFEKRPLTDVKLQMPLILKAMPSLIALELTGVQPMSAPNSEYFKLAAKKVVYNDDVSC